jgi:hypothetical protein
MFSWLAGAKSVPVAPAKSRSTSENEEELSEENQAELLEELERLGLNYRQSQENLAEQMQKTTRRAKELEGASNNATRAEIEARHRKENNAEYIKGLSPEELAAHQELQKEMQKTRRAMELNAAPNNATRAQIRLRHSLENSGASKGGKKKTSKRRNKKRKTRR